MNVGRDAATTTTKIP